MNFKSLPQLLDNFKDEKTCIEYFEKLRWNGKPICPSCRSTKIYKTNRGYKCANNECYKVFNVKTGTIFENSKIPFRMWFAAIYLLTGHKKGISSVQLAIYLNVTQKTAWFMLHRIRQMLEDKTPEFLGTEAKIVEVDETHIGGKEKNRHYKKKRHVLEEGKARDGSPYNEKKIVIGVIERNGKVILKHIPNATKENMIPFIEQYVPKGSRIMSDEHKAYTQLGHEYVHLSVTHSCKVYVIGDVHTNTIENFWSVLKRGLYGIYHQVSDKHLERYLNEFSGRFNTRKLSEQDRFEFVLTKSENRLLYKKLIAND